MNEDQRATVVIHPQFLPRDGIDVCLGISVGALQAAVLFGAPALLTFIVFRLLGAGVIVSVCLGFLVFCLVYGLVLLFVVWRLTVSTDGLHFHRVLGSPKVLSWNRIVSAEIASRRELVLQGWLWPLFPPREITPSLSALQHYRITWDAGFCYYPPACIEDFEKHVVSKLRKV